MEVKMGTTSPLTFIESSGTKVRAPLAVPILVYGKELAPSHGYHSGLVNLT